MDRDSLLEFRKTKAENTFVADNAIDSRSGSGHVEMIDSNTPDLSAESPSPVPMPPRTPAQSPPPIGLGETSELYSDLFELGPTSSSLGRGVDQVATFADSNIPAPVSPVSLAETGLGLMQICNLVLKQLYLQGNLLGVQIARHARLPFQVIDECLRFLKEEKCIEVASGDLIGPASYRFNLTDTGRERAKEAFQQCRYVGPAPVPLESYIEQCRLQTVTGTSCNPEALRQAFENIILRPEIVEELGPAVCSGKSIFVYGPPGNGKTIIAKGLGKFLNTNGGEVYVPYAIDAENSIITVFDPTIHHPTDDADVFGPHAGDMDADISTEAIQAHMQPSVDLRWRRIRRPVVMTGGELTLEMLDLRYNKASNFYTAPLHIKANSGVFLIDDFGRQIVSPRDLLNRWILPLEERIDYLTLVTGKKLAVPFEQLIIFSTNLDPRELVDEAFLRRIRHKIQIFPPNRELFTDIFRLNCEQRDIEYNQSAVDHLYSQYYDQGKSPRSSDPRDLLEIAQSICRFRNQEVLLTADLVAEAAKRFFCQV